MPTNTKDLQAAQEAGRLKRLVRRAKRLLIDLEEAGYVISLVSGGGTPHAVIHPENISLELDSRYDRKPNVHDLGSMGVGEMLAL